MIGGIGTVVDSDRAGGEFGHVRHRRCVCRCPVDPRLVGPEPDLVTATTCSPCSASRRAVAVPMGPAPTTRCFDMETSLVTGGLICECCSRDHGSQMSSTKSRALLSFVATALKMLQDVMYARVIRPADRTV